MYNQSARPQVQYTLDTLSSTLYQLMESQPFSEITVTALCRAAGVGRRSYYHNCDTAEDLVIYRIRKKVRENLSQVDFRCEDAPKLYRLFFEYWSKYGLPAFGRVSGGTAGTAYTPAFP